MACRYRSERAMAREQAVKEILARTPGEAKKALASFVEAGRKVHIAEQHRADTRKKTELILSRLGFSLREIYQGSKPNTFEIEIGKHNTLKSFDETTARISNTLRELKRTYTLKLYASCEDASKLISSLATELQALVK